MRYVLRNDKGETCIIDGEQKRLEHMRARIRAWVWTINKLDKPFVAMGFTLTYRPGEIWQPKQISRLIAVLRKNLGARLYAYAWVAELHPKGHGIHYHLCLVVAPGTRIPFLDRPWGDCVPWAHGLTRYTMLTRVSGSYLCKYLQKSSDVVATGVCDFPRHCRRFAVAVYNSSGLTLESRHEFRLSAVPSRVRKWVSHVVRLFGEVHGVYWHWRLLDVGWRWCVGHGSWQTILAPTGWHYAGLACLMGL